MVLSARTVEDEPFDIGERLRVSVDNREVPGGNRCEAWDRKKDLLSTLHYLTSLEQRSSGRYWTRTNDPHDVNVVL